MEKYKNPALSPEERAGDLLERMTLEEKVAQMDMIRGVELATKVHEAHYCAVDEDSDFCWEQVRESLGDRGMGFVHDVYAPPKVLNKLQRYMVEQTRLGIPCIFTGEALHGLSWPGASIFPMPINMGASFDTALTKRVGRGIAAETRSLGIQEILAPNLDLAREPRWGRTEETFGEDTYLSSQMAYAIITGEQGEDLDRPDTVMAEPKHYCVHGIPEGGLNCAPARVGKREVESAYLPVFEAGIKKAGACNAMASFNCIDAEAVIASPYYLREILKERFGLKGYVRSDFSAVSRLIDAHHMCRDKKESIEVAVKAGLDVQGFDFPNEVWQETLAGLVKEGKIEERLIDDSVRRILEMKFRLGLFEHPYTDEEAYRKVVRCKEHQAVSYRMAQESIVLLQNKNKALPLDKNISSVAVLGPSSGKQRLGSYTSVPWGYKVNSVYEEICQRVGAGCRVTQVEGCGVTEYDAETIPQDWFADGIVMEFFDNDGFRGEPVGTQIVRTINFNWILAKPHRKLPFKGYSVRMKGRMKVNTHDLCGADSFWGKLVFMTNDSVRILVDNVCVIDSAGDHRQQTPSCKFFFEDGKEHEIEIQYICDVNGSRLTFCVDHHEENIEKAVEAAKNSDVAIIVCGDNKVTSGEGYDRCDLKLFGHQQALIRAVGALGKPVILVLENGKAVDLTMETETADAILATWFGGEFGAKAIVDVLFGDISPSGKLPVSFPKDVGCLPCYYSRLPGGSKGYLEGGWEARFPFGYGLSYTSFTYEDMKIEKGEGSYDYQIGVTVGNEGTMEADEVVQLYVQDIYSSIVTPDKLLQGFARITLRPGEKKEVIFKLGFDSFRLMNAAYEWVVEPGEFKIMVGSSSEDIRLEDIITIF